MIKKCFELARHAGRDTFLNPLVGAVLCDFEGNILSTGYHKKYGEAHAEVNCINSYSGDFSKTILYVSLEPCSHYGKTPPCADLIIEKGIPKVVVSTLDPNPIVSGRGIEKLKQAGVEVKVGVLEDEGRALNKVFFKNILSGKPYVATKIATTLDGKIATLSGSSKWITGAQAREYVRNIRSSFWGIMSASGTILADNSNLTCAVPLTRIILDNSHKIPSDFNVFKENGSRIIYVSNSRRNLPSHIEQIEFENYEKLFLDLYELKIPSVLVEAGAGLNSRLIKEGQIDYLYQFIASKIAGKGISYSDENNISDINNSKKLKFLGSKFIGEDILLEAEFVV
ncbi:bifunctional diaminohydroxyphosphoribosylaminopyrimidine deaminase/5-amino-6-(5-phosphoribosylamino)uracil reductase RibD [bacterium]|nr:bifunctional diaminohydroxyphosphoribosylaminopyrimidine deaminase/5-amino-6-(5-phosphoribosylamino)uracil reductase RibD [bacterium]